MITPQPSNPDTQLPRRIGGLIPQFPQQTHIACWRMLQAMRRLGVEVHMLSTRRPPADQQCHQVLIDEADRTHYAWPAELRRAAGWLLRHPGGLMRAIGYIVSLKQAGVKQKLKLLPLILAAADLAAYAHREKLEHIFVHSCADAAHLVALANRMSGPAYSLRLGGDLEAYGKDHPAKMRQAAFLVPAAAVNKTQIASEVGYPPDRMFWTWFGIDVEHFKPTDQGRDDATDRPLRLITVARLNRAKGHIHALAALRLALDAGVRATYAIVGAGPYEPEIRAKIDALNLSEHVTLHGALDQQHVLELLQQSDVFVLPSTGVGEASPMACVEAMACGLPVIASIIGGTPYIVTDQVDGDLVNKADESAIARAIERFASNPEQLRQFSQAARDRAVRDFDCNHVARRIARAMAFTATHPGQPLPDDILGA